MQIEFTLYHQGDLLNVRAHMHEDCLAEDGGGAAHVEEVQLLPPIGLRMGARARVVAMPLKPEAELAAIDAVDDICRLAAALTHRPWEGYVKPTWATSGVQTPRTDDGALRLAAQWWSEYQERDYDDDHPTGRSDAQTYREEAPYPWR